MSLRFTVLASGSGGNATLVQNGAGGILIDAGLGKRQLTARLMKIGASWESVHGLLLTHTHSDHWNDAVFGVLLARGMPLYCHPGHHPPLENYSRYFPLLKAAGLVRDYECERHFFPLFGLRCRSLPVRHDCEETFGFRMEGGADLFGHAEALAYVTDLGSWDEGLADALADVDALALEFNHDVEMECRSRRSAALIARVLGDAGHLSNEQAAGLLAEVLRRSSPGRLRQVVQLHLSRECNRPSLAVEAARTVLDQLERPIELYTAHQYRTLPAIHLGEQVIRRRHRSFWSGSRAASTQTTPASLLPAAISPR